MGRRLRNARRLFQRRSSRMTAISWKYASPLSREMLDATQRALGVSFPDSYVECVLRNNGGRPRPSTFDYSGRRGAVFHRLLPVEIGEKNGILAILNALADRLPPGYIPFASDSFGNYLCFRYPSVGGSIPIYFWDHEISAEALPSLICGSFDELLARLY